ncbi:MAG TPA: methyltransferase domain-containing protein [Candidatus Syntrophoarchaeum butanivorans]|uniref:tRNA (guanine(10)-N(2))-dimethyltransferase n=1 Tax=Candidatus Syntropharchaeum butanivorans TaxID=1839936 RepID=A0A1F2P4B6_9EURY|nr:MAG: RNA methyltransferase [Candidatus Syntrophoarchaeum butanivorans]HEC57192.1 methyltransferase domain-containing protein [Candidatus Syntrophoarchaeum butanivorans]
MIKEEKAGRPCVIYGFELSGEDERLPEAEIIALFETYGIEIERISRLNRLLLLEVRGEGGSPEFHELISRIALSHLVLEVFALTDATLEEIESAALEMRERIRGSYAVDVKIWNNRNFSTLELERLVGSWLYHGGVWVDLKEPGTLVKLYIIEDKAVIGKVIHTRDRRGFRDRLPHHRPFFAPGVLKPKLARALVNLSRLKPSERLLDPFAGTGGILLEAGLMGMVVMGLDIQEKMVRGASENLRELEHASLILGDARTLPFKDASVDGVVTDPPYGRSSKIKGGSIEMLYRSALCEINRILKYGRFAVILADRPVEEVITEAGLLLIDRYSLRIHRSMIRWIYLLRKDPGDVYEKVYIAKMRG